MKRMWVISIGMFLVIAAVCITGCTSSSDSPTQLKISGLDPPIITTSISKVEITVLNTGEVTANNVVVGVANVREFDIALKVLDNQTYLEEIAKLGEGDAIVSSIDFSQAGLTWSGDMSRAGTILDKDYLEDIKPGKYGKGIVIITVDNSAERGSSYTPIIYAVADNAPAVYYRSN